METIYEGEFTADDILILAQGIMEERMVSGKSLTSPGLLRQHIQLRATGKKREEFHVIFLDTQNCLIHEECMFEGTLDSCHVYVREIICVALEVSAASVIVWHNHPSGSTEPSVADRQLTKKIKEALALVDIRLLDHLIAGHGIVSMAEMGMI